MPARILEVCDAVAARLIELTPGLAVKRRYTLDVPPTGPSVRTVYVFPARYGQDGTATRADDRNGYGVSVVVAERVGTPPGADDALAAWQDRVDALVEWVEGSVYDPLQDPRGMPVLPAPAAALWPQAAEVAAVYDEADLRAGVFVSELRFDFQELS